MNTTIDNITKNDPSKKENDKDVKKIKETLNGNPTKEPESKQEFIYKDVNYII